MQSSMLKMCIDIFKILMEHGPLSMCELLPILNDNSSSLEKNMTFLTGQGMIVERENNSVITYVITNRGIEILKFFRVQPSIVVRID